MKEKLDLIFFLGLPISVPIGILFAFVVGVLGSYYESLQRHGIFDLHYMGIQRETLPAMLAIFMATVLFIFLVNLKKYFIDRQRDFNPLRNWLVSSISDDKRRAQNNPIPKKYQSREPKGFTIGKQGKKYTFIPFADDVIHQFIMGPPGTRKTSLVLNPLIRHFNFDDSEFRSVLAVDAKPELSRKSAYEDDNDVIIINPTSFDSVGFDVFYGLPYDCTDDALKERATVIAKALIPNLSNDNSHFSTAAQNLFVGFVMYGYRKGLGFAESVVKIQRAVIQDYISEVCADPDMEGHEKIKGMVSGYEGNDSDEAKSVESTLKENLTIFDIDTVQHCLSGNDKKATPFDLIEGKSIFLAIPDHLLDQYSKLFAMIMELCLKELMSQEERGLLGELPIWFLCDEAGSIYIPSLLAVTSRGRSKKIQCTVVAQDFDQYLNLYGTSQANSIYSNCKTKIILACDNVPKAREISAQIGAYGETKITDHKPTGTLNPGGNARNVTEEQRSIMDVSDIYQLEDKNQVLVLTQGKWFLTDKCTYKDIPMYDDMSERVQEYNDRLHPVVSDTNTSAVSDKSHYESKGVRHLIEKMKLDNNDNIRR